MFRLSTHICVTRPKRLNPLNSVLDQSLSAMKTLMAVGEIIVIMKNCEDKIDKSYTEEWSLQIFCGLNIISCTMLTFYRMNFHVKIFCESSSTHNGLISQRTCPTRLVHKYGSMSQNM